MPAYLDHAASTPMHPEAVEAMGPFWTEHFANPSGAHTMARAARKAVDEARDTIAEIVGADPREVVFTGGGTEADNLAVFGVHDRVGGVVVASSIEHHAVLDPVRARHGREVGVDARGRVDAEALAGVVDGIDAAGDAVSLVSLMAVNNETGAIQPLPMLAKRIRRHAPDAVTHTDAVQALSWIDVPPAVRDFDMVSISGHKFGGPKGVGALVVRERAAAQLSPRVLGGGQERERRSGTQNVAGIVGMATAARITVERRDETVERVTKLRDRLAAGILASVPEVVETGVADGDRSHVAGGIVHVCIDGVQSESLLFLLEQAEVFASAGSSCASGAEHPSHVLAAMGVPATHAQGALRLSLGWSSTDADVDAVLAALPPAVERLRAYPRSRR